MNGKSAKIIKEGSAELEVNRSGITQKVRFIVKEVKFGKFSYQELFTEKLINYSELQRLSNATELPVESNNIRAFPNGKGAKDFIQM